MDGAIGLNALRFIDFHMHRSRHFVVNLRRMLSVVLQKNVGLMVPLWLVSVCVINCLTRTGKMASTQPQLAHTHWP